MEITPLFRACVKSVKTRNKAFGLNNEQDKNRILRKKEKNPLLTRARDIASQITRLRDFLLENRMAYLNFSNFLNDGVVMSDSERDQIDNGAQRIVNTCSHIIQEFKKETKSVRGTPQMDEMVDGVVRLLECYLKSVCAILVEQRAVRVKRARDVRNLSTLAPTSGNLSLKKPSDRDVSNSEEDLDGDDKNSSKENLNKSSLEVAREMDSFANLESDQLSAEEMQIFESENAQLYDELNSLSEEVKQIESKVIHIAELQEIFTEKVLQQNQDIDRISSTVLGATENVRDANEQIKQAIQRNAGLRVWILFFLLVMSFSLLFLDWYNA